MTRPSCRAAAYGAAVFAAVTLVWLMFLQHPGINGFPRAMYGDMIYGHAQRPFVTRALLPITTCLVMTLIPQGLKNAVIHHAEGPTRLHALFHNLKWEPGYAPEYFIGIALMYAAFWGFYFSLRGLARQTYGTVGGFANFASLLGVVAVPTMFKYYSYIYDPPALFLFTLGLLVLARAQWKLFLVVFALGCINKETTILLALVFALHYRDRMDRSLFLRLLFAQVLVFLAARGVFHYSYRNNPGLSLEWHFFDNLRLLKPYTLATLLAWVGLGALVAHRWAEKPRFLRDAFWVLPPLVVLTFLFGLYDELRDYYEAYPAVVLLACDPIYRFVRQPAES